MKAECSENLSGMAAPNLSLVARQSTSRLVQDQIFNLRILVSSACRLVLDIVDVLYFFLLPFRKSCWHFYFFPVVSPWAHWASTLRTSSAASPRSSRTIRVSPSSSPPPPHPLAPSTPSPGSPPQGGSRPTPGRGRGWGSLGASEYHSTIGSL